MDFWNFLSYVSSFISTFPTLSSCISLAPNPELNRSERTPPPYPDRGTTSAQGLLCSHFIEPDKDFCLEGGVHSYDHAVFFFSEDGRLKIPGIANKPQRPSARGRAPLLNLRCTHPQGWECTQKQNPLEFAWPDCMTMLHT